MPGSKIKITACLVTVFLGGLSACSSLLDRHVEYTYEKPERFPVLKAIGYAPVSLQPGKTDQQKMILAMRASKLEAYRELAEQVYGHKVTAESSVRGMVAQSDTLNSKVQGIVRGAKVVKTYAVDDTYATELELDMKQVYDLYKNTNREKKVKRVMYY